MRSRSWYFLITLVLLGGTLAASHLSEQRKPEPLRSPLSSIPKQVDGWTGEDAKPLDEHTLAVLRPTSYLDRIYRRGGDVASLFISYYAEQRAGESMHSPKNCLPGAGWEIWDYGSARIRVGGESVDINKYSIQNNGNRMVVLYWYQSRHRVVASEYLGKVLLVKDALLRGDTSGSIVRIMVADRPELVGAGGRFAAAIIPEVQYCLGGGS
ncbi:MAG TPA: EpsI family protein [Bryobacteraceae bacterium]|nr:EpsI family protein [Bryobacteraceae bacterium]